MGRIDPIQVYFQTPKRKRSSKRRKKDEEEMTSSDASSSSSTFDSSATSTTAESPTDKVEEALQKYDTKSDGFLSKEVSGEVSKT